MMSVERPQENKRVMAPSARWLGRYIRINTEREFDHLGLIVAVIFEPTRPCVIFAATITARSAHHRPQENRRGPTPPF